MESTLAEILRWVNYPLFHIGSTPVTLGGMLSAFLIFWLSLFVSGVTQRIVLSRITKNLRLTSGMSYAINRILHYCVLFLGLVLAAQCIGINLGSFAVVFGFMSVGIGFGLQNITSNFISGIILLLERPVSVGDLVSVENQIGRVDSIKMRSTVINTLDNVTIIVPNSQFIEGQVTNWSYSSPVVRIHCPVGVAYGSDVPKVKQVLLDVATNHPDVLDKPVPDVWFQEFADSSLNFELLIWTNQPWKQFILRSQINYAIDAAFREADIKIPFPQRDVHLIPQA